MKTTKSFLIRKLALGLTGIISVLLLVSCSSDKEIIYSTIYPSLPKLESPLILQTKACHWEYPIQKDDKVFIGLDEENFKCYIENQEIQREQRLLYEQFVSEVNKEREEWNKLNDSKK